jgi:N-acylneuraminate cytidylyltransferase
MNKKICIIPARGLSKRIPKKNIKNFLGKPIISYTIQAAIKSNLFDLVIVSTDDNNIAEISKSYGAKVPFLRSKQNASDFSTTFDVIDEVISVLKNDNQFYEYCCCIYPCAPFVTSNKLEKSFNKFTSNNYDSFFPVVKYGHPVQRAINLDEKGFIKSFNSETIKSRSQDLENYYHDAGQFYWFKIDPIIKQKQLITPLSGCFVVSELEAQDIDNNVDWALAELKYKLLK